MNVFTDQLGRKVEIKSLPERIISLVPSQTELIYELGCGDKIIAQTIFCKHPESEFKKAVKIGGPKKLNISKIIELKPDLIIGNKEENTKEEIEKLEKYFPVWLSDIYNLEDAYWMINEIGKLLERTQKSEQLVNKIKSGFDKLLYKDKKTCMYMIWKKPYMAVGGNTFIDFMLSKSGFENVCSRIERYPILEIDQMRELAPEVVILSSEPYPFKEKHIAEFKEIFPYSKIILADGEMFTWYGSRLKYSASYFEELRRD